MNCNVDAYLKDLAEQRIVNRLPRTCRVILWLEIGIMLSGVLVVAAVVIGTAR